MSENKETIRVLLLEHDKRARIVTIQGDANSLRQALGGDFEPIHSLSENVCVLGRTGAQAAQMPVNRTLRTKNELCDMPYRQLTSEFYKQESGPSKEHLTGYIVFTQDSFSRPYPEMSRTYVVSSNNKAFITGMGGYSIYGGSLDNTDPCVRLEGYMAAEHGGKDGWKIERCGLVKEGKEITAAVYGPCLICGSKDGKITSLDEADLYWLKDKYHLPERVQEVDGKLQATSYYPGERNHGR